MRVTLKRIDGVWWVSDHQFTNLHEALKFIYDLRGGNKNGTEH